MTPSEIEVYEFLLRSGASAATAVAKGTRRSRGRTYQTLRSLAERGLVRERPTEPVEYHPVPPAEVIELLLAASRRRDAELSALLGKARTRTREPQPRAPEGPPPGASLLRGRRAVSAEVLRFVDSANQRLWIAGAGRLPDRIRGHKALLGSLQAASDRGVDVALALAPPGDLPAQANPFPEVHGVRFAAVPLETPLSVNLVVGDGAALLVLPQPDDESITHGDDFGLRLEGARMAAAAASWVSSLVVSNRVPALSEKAAATAEELGEAIDGARSSVQIMGTAAWLDAASGKSDADALRVAARRGVTVELVTELEPGVWRRVRPLLGVCKVRASQTAPVGALIVDDAACFVEVAGAHEGERPMVRRAIDPLEVRHLAGLFRRFWDQGADLAG